MIPNPSKFARRFPKGRRADSEFATYLKRLRTIALCITTGTDNPKDGVKTMHNQANEPLPLNKKARRKVNRFANRSIADSFDPPSKRKARTNRSNKAYDREEREHQEYS